MYKAEVPSGLVDEALLPSGPHRLVLLYASPLCCETPRGPVPLPQIPFEREWEMLLRTHAEVARAPFRIDQACSSGSRCSTRPPRLRPAATISAQPLTSASLRRAMMCVQAIPSSTSAAATVLQLSAHGVQDRLVMEDGRGTAHFLGCDMLASMLSGQHLATKLVVLNACSLHSLAAQFARCGVPHVICCVAELRDSASHVFLHSLYSTLLQGGTVLQSFNAGVVAMRSDPDTKTQAVANSFRLLPEEVDHNEALFQPVSSTAPVPGEDDRRSTLPASRSLGSSRTTRTNSLVISDALLRKHDTESSTEEPDADCSSGGPAETSSSEGGRETTSSSDSEFSSMGCQASANSSESALLLPSRRVRAVASRSHGGRSCRSAVVSQRHFSGSATSRADQTTSRNVKMLSSHTRRMHGSTVEVDSLQSPLTRAVPPVPEDFVGRALDVWAVLQHLSARRAVVICVGPNEEYGVGKSTVLDAVHRTFSLQMGGVCVAARLRALSEVETNVSGWIDKVKAAVLSAQREYEAGRGGPRHTTTMLQQKLRCVNFNVLRRRTPKTSNAAASAAAIKRGFHPLSDPIATRPAIQELVAEMATLAELCEARCREWPAVAGRVVLILDECDHLIQQQHFQEALSEILRCCSQYRIVLSTHQRMVGTAGGWFKVVHQQLQGLGRHDAARLFLRRIHRPLRWEELLPEGSDTPRTGPVNLTGANESEVLSLVADHPAVAARRGNPRQLIELASRVDPSLKTLRDLAPVGYHRLSYDSRCHGKAADSDSTPLLENEH